MFAFLVDAKLILSHFLT